METLKNLMPLATVVISLIALFTGQSIIMNWQIQPVKENQARMETRMETRMDKIELKLDQLIMSQSQKNQVNK